MPTTAPATRPLILALLLLLTLAAIAGCGGDESSEESATTGEDPQALVERAFAEPIESADVSLDLDVELEGGEAVSGPFKVQLSGPCRSNGPDEFASFGYQLALQGGGATVPPLTLVATGDNLFVEVVGTSYEFGDEVFADLNRQIEGDAEAAAACGTLGFDTSGPDLPSLMENLEVAGEETVGGVQTTHVTGTIAIERIVSDLNSVAQQANQLREGTAPELNDQELEQLTDSVDDPPFDLFVGEDGVLRGFNSSFSFGPSAGGAGGGALSSGSISVSLEFADVGGDQEITPPEDPRPIADLLQQVAGLSGLLGEGGIELPGLPGGGASAGGGGGGGAAAGGPAQPGAVPSPGAQPGGSAADEVPGAEAFQQYSDCLSQADVTDQGALAECNELLTP